MKKVIVRMVIGLFLCGAQSYRTVSAPIQRNGQARITVAPDFRKTGEFSQYRLSYTLPNGWKVVKDKSSHVLTQLIPKGGQTNEKPEITIYFEQAFNSSEAQMQKLFESEKASPLPEEVKVKLVAWQPSGLNLIGRPFLSGEFHTSQNESSPYSYKRELFIDVGDGVYCISQFAETLADLRNPACEEFFNSLRLEPIPTELLKSYDTPSSISTEQSAQLRAVAERWLHQLYARNYSQAEQGLSTLVRRDKKKKEIQALLEYCLEGTDPAISATRKFLQLRRSYILPEEDCPILYYESIAANKQRILEVVLMCLDQDKQWRILDYKYQEREGQSLEKELARINADSALVIPSQAVDGYPLWSPAGDYVAARVNSSVWYKVNLNTLSLDAATWRDKKTLGVLRPISIAISPATMSEITSFGKQAKYHPREVITRDETKIELKQKGFSTSLILTRKGQPPNILWSSDLENCHSLNLSPDEKNVAFLCERNGVVILNLSRVK